jgi:hypothetical protein
MVKSFVLMTQLSQQLAMQPEKIMSENTFSFQQMGR